MNKQLQKHKIIVKSGAIVDASIIDTPLKPKVKTRYEIATDRSEEGRAEQELEKEEQVQVLIEKEQPGVDAQARWIKKAGKTRYGYKKHHVTDTEGSVIGLLTTPANVNETTNLKDVLATADLPDNIFVYGDKGYRSAKNEEVLKGSKLKSRILHKAKKGQPLTEREILRNKLIGKTRFKAERTFGGIKRWFNPTCARDYVMTEHETLGKKAVLNSIWMGSYTLDSHVAQRYVKPDGFVQYEGDIGVEAPKPYSISYGAIIPKESECKNLLVPVCLSSSHIAYGSIRMEPVFMILGASAATAASIAIDDKTSVQKVNYDKLKTQLLKNKQRLTL